MQTIGEEAQIERGLALLERIADALESIATASDRNVKLFGKMYTDGRGSIIVTKR